VKSELEWVPKYSGAGWCSWRQRRENGEGVEGPGGEVDEHCGVKAELEGAAVDGGV
jgi:hypothetical protein